MLKNFLLVGIGGAAGSMLRYACSLWFRSSGFPLATFLVNMIGCFVIGLVFGLSIRSASFEQNWRVFLAAGVCGGFTTYSAFSMEMVALFQQHKFVLFTVYLLATIACGLLATWLGYSFVK